MRAAARLAWDRLDVYRRHAHEEAERLKHILEEAVASSLRVRAGGTRRAREPLASSPDPLALAVADILLLFSRDYVPVGSASRLHGRLTGAFHALLTKRYGPRSRFSAFEPTHAEEGEAEQEERSIRLTAARVIRASPAGPGLARWRTSLRQAVKKARGSSRPP